MRSKAVRTVALVLVLAGAGLIAAQQKQPARPPGKSEGPRVVQQKAPATKSNVDEIMAEALKNNPTVRLAAARLAEAEAELHRVRLEVMQRITVLNADVEYLRKSIDDSQQVLTELEKQYQAGNAPLAGVVNARQQLFTFKAKLAAEEAELSGILGKPPQGAALGTYPKVYGSGAAIFPETQSVYSGPSGEAREARIDVTKVQGAQAERMRKALQTSIKVDYKDMTVGAILKDLAKKVPGLSFHDQFSNYNKEKWSLHFEEELPVSAVLQALSDETECRFFVREYGILATAKAKPHGAMTVQEFLRQ